MTVPGEPAAEPKLTLNLLMVEDRPEDFSLVVRELGKGHRLITPRRVETETALVIAIQQQLPDIILCDHGGMAYDSFSALRQVRAISPDVPFIVVSGRPGDDLVRAALQKGANAWVSKQRLPELIPAVRQALQQSGERRRTRRLEREREVLRAEVLALRASRHRRVVLPICASCQRIRNELHVWVAAQVYLESEVGVRYSHGLCPDCAGRDYTGGHRSLGMG
jgi:CheY-like chemotaxis protein